MTDWGAIADYVNDQVIKKAGDELIGFLTRKLPGKNVISYVFGELLFPDAANQSEVGLDYDALERDRLVQDGLEVLRKLPVQYDKGKPSNIATYSPEIPKAQPPSLLPVAPNSFPKFDPLLIPRTLFNIGKKAIAGRSATERVYGDSECWPVSRRTDVVFTVAHDVIGAGRRKENLATGAANYLKWMVRENGALSKAGIEDAKLEGGENLHGDALWDQVALMGPADPGNWTGGHSFTFGAAAIADEFADYAAGRHNCGLGGIRPVIYLNKPEIKVKESGNVDISSRFSNEDLSSSWDGLASKIKDYVEYYGKRKIKQLDIVNNSHGKTAKAVGVDQFPLFMPRSLCNHEADDLRKFAEEEIRVLQEQASAPGLSAYEKQLLEEQIEYKQGELAEILSGDVKRNEAKSLLEVTGNGIELIAEVLGAWPLKIDIEPGHLLTQSLGPKENKQAQAGNQSAIENGVDPQELFEVKTLKEPIKMRFPNIGETFAEIQYQLLNMQGIQSLQTEFLTRMAAMQCSAANVNIKTFNNVECILDWIGMKIEHQDDYYILSFDPHIAGDPENEELLKYLIGQKVNIKKPVFAVDKDHQTLTASQFWYARACTIITNALYRKFDGKAGSPYKDPATFIRAMKEMADTMGGFDGFSIDNENQRVSLSFADMRKLFENGFDDLTATTADDHKPYGEDKDHSPLVDQRVATLGKTIYGG